MVDAALNVAGDGDEAAIRIQNFEDSHDGRPAGPKAALRIERLRELESMAMTNILLFPPTHNQFGAIGQEGFEGNQSFQQLVFADKLLKFRQGQGTVFTELCDGGAAEASEMSRTTDALADVVGERANIGAAGAFHGKARDSIHHIKAQKLQRIDFHFNRR